MIEPIRLVSPRPADWGELFTAFLVGALVGMGLMLACPTSAEAGQVVVTIMQPTDCGEIEAFELLGAPLPNPATPPPPTGAPVLATLPNVPACTNGVAFTKTSVSVNTLGMTRFWARAVNTTGIGAPGTSGVSPEADASIPLGKPSSLTIVAP